MARVLIPVPQEGADPTEVAVPWAALNGAGHDVLFATQTGAVAACDTITLTGDGLPLHARLLRARADNRALHDAMVRGDAWRAPMMWASASATDFDAIVFPGGHAPGMRAYCESGDIQRLASEAFAAAMPVAAICHGVLPLARAKRGDGTPLLTGKTTTSLTAIMERASILLTRRALGDHYRTYPENVETEARRAVGASGRYLRGPALPRYATRRHPDTGFVVADGAYLSARWPGDAWTLARRLADRLSG